MLGKVLFLATAHAAQVNDTFKAGCMGSTPKAASRGEIALIEVRAAAHAVNEIIGGIHPFHNSGESSRIQHIPLDHFNTFQPGPAL